MTRKIIDLSVPIENDVPSDPPIMEPTVHYMDHEQTVPQLTGFFPGLTQDDLPGGEAWALEKLEVFTHNGTHLDAPYHFHSTMDGGKRAITIDEVPLEWCFGRGVKLDFRELDDGYVATADDVRNELERTGVTLREGDIVVVNPRAGALYGTPEYLSAGCGVGREATLWLLERGIRITGTDAWSWDAPFVHTAKRYEETGDASIIWEGHRAGMEIGYCHIEKLHNLEKLPATGFQVACFPVKIKRASAGWTRAVAILEE